MYREHSTVISAPPPVVWRLTTDVERWPSFMPTVQAVTLLEPGPLRVGSSARVKQPGQTAAVWTVATITPETEFTWETRRMGLRMIGRHLLAPTGDGTRNTLSIEVTGHGAGIFAMLFGSLIARTIQRENEAFQRAAGQVAA
ncbi:SRPBCC family protein [Actinoplanes sp. KI2]|uniref:SRPBCC family protein n=1 Tax=Actinoplanes sp. KI2 TaxID=2983315 RepID=UPI0021D5E189|nr:SRPBCC family protein [Actinoplanes sp. KI2]MCU7722775.1 SRPBCC family protein [Actinoplanes sp. KI2]